MQSLRSLSVQIADTVLAAMSLKLKPSNRIATLTQLAFGTDNPRQFKTDSLIMQWWSRSTRMNIVESSIRSVASFLETNCPFLLALRGLFVELMNSSQELPGARFIGAALKLEETHILNAIGVAELIVATRILSLDPRQVSYDMDVLKQLMNKTFAASLIRRSRNILANTQIHIYTR